jgi:hypothetical protein
MSDTSQGPGWWMALDGGTQLSCTHLSITSATRSTNRRRAADVRDGNRSNSDMPTTSLLAVPREPKAPPQQ